MSLIDDTIRLVEANGDNVYMPELLRVKASMHLSNPATKRGDAEGCLVRSRASELRTATDLAMLWTAQDRVSEARTLLLPGLEQFTEG